MPILEFDTSGTCTLCGSRIKGGGVAQCRINRRSIRVADRGGLFFRPWRCHECGFEAHSVPEAARLSAKGLAVVTAYREKRWPATNEPTAHHRAMSDQEAAVAAVRGDGE